MKSCLYGDFLILRDDSLPPLIYNASCFAMFPVVIRMEHEIKHEMRNTDKSNKDSSSVNNVNSDVTPFSSAKSREYDKISCTT